MPNFTVSTTCRLSWEQPWFNWVAGAILVGIWLLFAKVFRISSLAAIISFAILPLAIYWQEQDLPVSLVFVALSTILIWRHKGNIQRLISGTEV